MVKKETMKMSLSDDTMLEVTIDRTSTDVVGIVHIFHGMAEHMDRYDRLVHQLNQQGYHVIRHNHRGHGKEINTLRGHFDSIEQVVKDAHEIKTTIQPTLNDKLPYIILGHSMGSIIARRYVQLYPKDMDGLILTGTGLFPQWKGTLLVFMLKIITLVTGKKRRLKWMNNLVIGSFNKGFKPTRTESDWISSDEHEVDVYVHYPYSGFLVSNQLIYSVMKTMMKTAQLNEISKMNSDLPILLISGKADPFGDNGKGIRRLGKILKKGGITHITVQLYKQKRHEILFEKDKETVWRHMLDWMSRQIIKKKVSE
ncbi:lysophospholipase [Staphylococcus chromogenes]|uniref:alpha/beta hydrolase n=1 Tax=Staphylococcus chromogenes TaxID=46126 RepID=UPI000D1BC90E|nr:alpha/beta hydrolase [Staphylococcus chromogenes]PTG50740.1 lysophospholipase [Staphylococcus chromogenes]